LHPTHNSEWHYVHLYYLIVIVYTYNFILQH
jgi:hypothetical protein